MPCPIEEGLEGEVLYGKNWRSPIYPRAAAQTALSSSPRITALVVTKRAEIYRSDS